MGAGRLSVYGLNGSERMAFLRLFGGWFLSLRLQLSYMVGIEGSVSPPFEFSHCLSWSAFGSVAVGDGRVWGVWSGWNSSASRRLTTREELLRTGGIRLSN